MHRRTYESRYQRMYERAVRYMHEQTPWRQLRVGRVLKGRYRIDAILGQGGWSAVYRALDMERSCSVVIKIFDPLISGNAGAEVRFASQMGEFGMVPGMLVALLHSNLDQVHEVNTVFDGYFQRHVYFVVREYIAGESLYTVLAKHTGSQWLPLHELLQLAIDLSDALEHAHARGYLHGDINPTKIMINLHGRAILTDIYTAYLVYGHYNSLSIDGSPGYRSPEIVRGEDVLGCVADFPSDIYSLGVTLYKMLSGRLPFEGNSFVQTLRMHLYDPPPDIRIVRPDVPDELGRILARCLAKDRHDRYQSASELSVALRSVRSNGRRKPL